MTKKLALILAAMTWLVAGHATPAWSLWMEGNALVEDCTSDNDWDVLVCSSYVIGVADMIEVNSSLEISGFSPICIPTTRVTGGQLRRVVVNYLNAHPEETHMAAVVLVIAALREAFPCQ
jgi:hypothetical protein